MIVLWWQIWNPWPGIYLGSLLKVDDFSSEIGKQSELALSCASADLSKGGVSHVSESIDIPVVQQDNYPLSRRSISSRQKNKSTLLNPLSNEPDLLVKTTNGKANMNQTYLVKIQLLL